MKRSLFPLLCLFPGFFPLAAFSESAPPDPGPEEAGLRLRWIVVPRPAPATSGYEVRLDLLNTSERDITLRGGWRSDDAGGLADYLEAATSIECVPAVAPWIGGVAEGQRRAPQPEQLLKAGEVLTLRWQTDRPRLKNRVLNPNEIQNPEFPFPGLYSVHATLEVITGGKTVALRSNEQLVPVNGSWAMPKYTTGQLWAVDGDKKTAVLGLGSQHKVELGDEFEIGSPKGMHWKFKVTEVANKRSVGKLELLTRSTYPPYANPPPPLSQAKFVRAP